MSEKDSSGTYPPIYPSLGGSPSVEDSFNSEHQPAPIVAIGNLGAGKSTILNALSGQVLFESGISLGSGLTHQLVIKEANGRRYMDTPGVADDTFKQAAGEALTEVFRQGGRMKILFFITQKSGKVVSQDVTTMRLILESVPEIGRNYGIILNKIPTNVLSQLSEGETFLQLILSLYAGIEDRFKNKNTLLLPLNGELDSKNNVLVHPSAIHPNLENFINARIPEACITPGQITEIQLDDFEKLSKQVACLESDLKDKIRQKAEKEKLVVQFEDMEKRKMKKYEETLKKNEEELQKMKKIIRDKEEAMRECKQRSETEIRDFKQRSENEKKELEQKEQEINDHKDQINKKKMAAEQRKAMENRRFKEWDLIELFGTDFGLQNTPKGVKGIINLFNKQAQANSTMKTNPQQQAQENSTMKTNPQHQAQANSTMKTNPQQQAQANSTMKTNPQQQAQANSTMQTNPQQQAQANLTRKTNPQHQAQANSTMKTNPQHQAQANSTMKTNPQQPPCQQDPQSSPAPIVAIGNPGSGKSTILNALAGQLLFESGISLGCGLTNQLDVKIANGRKFMDTPGMADDTYSQAAADALKKVFHDGGRMKVLFFITQDAGRIVSQDVTTMKLVLESVPEIGRNYGVIVNKIPRNVLSQLTDEETYLKLFLSLNAGIKAEFKNLHVLLVPLNDKLSNIDNTILHPSDIHQNLLNFINTNIPDVYITPGKITEIRVNDFEKMNEQVQNLQYELKKNKELLTAETDKLQTELANIEKEKMKQRDEELQKLKIDIRDKEEKIKPFKQRSENDKIMEMEMEIKKMKKEMNNQENEIKMLKEESKQKKAKPYNHDKAWNLLYKLLKEGRQDAEGAVAHEEELG